MQGSTSGRLGKEMGMSAMAISKYETGEVVPNSRVLIQLSQTLHVPLDFFFRSIEVTLSEPQVPVPEGAEEKRREDDTQQDPGLA